MIISTNAYRWIQHYESLGTTLEDHIEEALAMAAEAGLDAFEPTLEHERHRDLYGKFLPASGLKMPSFYTPGNLIGPDPDTEVARVLERCRWGKDLGATIAVMNPDPVNWNGTPKPDDLLRRQTEALKVLSREASAMGIQLAFHFHTPELMMGAREVHHTFLEIPASHLSFCFDIHWAWRGCGNSQIAAEDLGRMYGDRIVSLHVRQSRDGVWTETLGEGDVDYQPIFRALRASGWDGVITEEQAVEEGTPVTMSQVDAHRESVEWLRAAWARAQPPTP